MARCIEIDVAKAAMRRDIALYRGESLEIRLAQPVPGARLLLAVAGSAQALPVLQAQGGAGLLLPPERLSALAEGQGYHFDLWLQRGSERTLLSHGGLVQRPAIEPLAEAMPVNLEPPVIEGTPQIGAALTLDTGVWEGAQSLLPVWNRDGRAIPGENGTAFAPGAEDEGHWIDAGVLAQGAQGGIYHPARGGGAVARAAPGASGLAPVVATLGAPLDVDLAASVTGKGLRFEIETDSAPLPEGLTLSPQGRLSGVPLAESPPRRCDVLVENDDGVMRLALTIEVVAAEEPELTRGDLRAIHEILNGGASAYAHGDDTYLSEAQGRLDDLSGWAAQTGAPVFGAGWIGFPASATTQRARHPLRQPVAAGTRMRVSWRQRGGGGVRLALGADNASSYQDKDGYWCADLIANADRGTLDVQHQGGSGAAEVTDITVRALDPALSDYDIILLAGQSNMVGASAGATADPGLDMPHPMVDVMQGATLSGYLATEGEITGAAAPLQHRALNAGLGPGMAFGRWYAENLLAPGRRVLLIAAARGGTALLNGAPTGPQDGSDAPWHPLNTLPAEADLFGQAAADLGAAMALGGNNRVVAMLWSQGESDRGASSAPLYRQAVSRYLVPALRDVTAAATMPVVILGLNPAVRDANTDAMRQAQAQLDQDSGHEDAVPGCIHVAWDEVAWGDGTRADPEDEADRVHFGADANRLRGLVAGRAFGARLAI